MEEVKKETVTTQEYNTAEVANTPTQKEATSAQTIEYLIYFFFGILEVLLTFRLILMVAGASSTSYFVSFIYGLTGIAVLPFEGIFRTLSAPGVETTSILQPATIIAIIVYAVIAFGVVKLVRILSGEKQKAE